MTEFKKYYLDNGEIYLIALGDPKFNKYVEKDDQLYMLEHKLGKIKCIIYYAIGLDGKKLFEYRL